MVDEDREIGERNAFAKAVTSAVGSEFAAVVAAFSDEEAAAAAYHALREAESSGGGTIEGVLVVRTDAHSKIHITKMTDHHAKSGVKWGVVGGVLVSVVFPPSAIAAAVAWGAMGGIVGKMQNEFKKSEVGAALSGTLGPEESGILVLVKASDVEWIKGLLPHATKVRSAGVDAATAEQITKVAAGAS